MVQNEREPGFLMHSARAAMAAGMTHIEEQVKAIERAVAENAGYAFDLAKTIVESACKTILNERKIGFDGADDLLRLFRVAVSALPLLPATAKNEADARKSLKQTLNGLHTALQGVCELRNNYGFASHGHEAARAAMGTAQAIFAAQVADAIIGFLHRAHHQDRAGPAAHLGYDDHPEFNEHVDEGNEAVHIFDLEYLPSEVLFNVDLEAYRNLLANFAAEEVA